MRHWSNQSVSLAQLPIQLELQWSLTVEQVCTGLHQAGYSVVIRCEVLLSVRVSRHHKHQTRKIFQTVQEVSLYQQKSRDPNFAEYQEVFFRVKMENVLACFPLVGACLSYSKKKRGYRRKILGELYRN